MQPAGVYSGTFDPVHFGHLRAALEVMEAAGLAAVRFVPCATPPHRGSPVASSEQRLAMLRLAIADQPGFVVDERELSRGGVSYMIDTLASLRSEVDKQPLCLILGMDAFLGLESWHRWREIASYAHVLVCHRPGWQKPQRDTLAERAGLRLVRNRRGLGESPGGGLYYVPVTQLDISSTALRATLAGGGDPRYLVPDSVRRYLGDHRPYAAVSCSRSTPGSDRNRSMRGAS